MSMLTAVEDRAEWKHTVSLGQTLQMYVKPNVTKTLLTRDHDTDERDVDRINIQEVVEKGMERGIKG